MIKKIFLIIIIFLGITFDLKSQSVTDIKPFQKGNDIIIKYKIINAKFNQVFNVSLFLSNDGGKTFQGPLEFVSGDIGKVYSKGNKRIKWDLSKDNIDIKGDLLFNIQVEVDKEKIKKKFFIASSSITDAPFGFSIGHIGGLGWYFSVRLNSKYNLFPSYKCDNNLLINYTGEGYYSFDGIRKIRRLSYTGGLTIQTFSNIYLYIGGGYGERDLLWHINEYDYTDNSKIGENYVENINYSYSGIETESGIIINVKSFYFSIGFSSQSFKTFDGDFGIGFVF